MNGIGKAGIGTAKPGLIWKVVVGVMYGVGVNSGVLVIVVSFRKFGSILWKFVGGGRAGNEDESKRPKPDDGGGGPSSSDESEESCSELDDEEELLEVSSSSSSESSSSFELADSFVFSTFVSIGVSHSSSVSVSMISFVKLKLDKYPSLSKSDRNEQMLFLNVDVDDGDDARDMTGDLGGDSTTTGIEF